MWASNESRCQTHPPYSEGILDLRSQAAMEDNLNLFGTHTPTHTLHSHTQFTRSLSFCTSRHVCAHTPLLHLHPHLLLVTEGSISAMETSGISSRLSPCATQASQPASPGTEEGRRVPLQRGCCLQRGLLSEVLSGLERRWGSPCLRPRTLTWNSSGSLQAGPLLKGIFGLGLA